MSSTKRHKLKLAASELRKLTKKQKHYFGPKSRPGSTSNYTIRPIVPLSCAETVIFSVTLFQNVSWEEMCWTVFVTALFRLFSEL